MERPMKMMEFRTPQHPSMGTNNWGGTSTMLARDIPKESLEQRYLRLNSTRTRDVIFPADDEGDESLVFGIRGGFREANIQKERLSVVAPPTRRGLLARLVMGRLRKEKQPPAQPGSVTLGVKRKRWFGRWDPKNRWPQGWC